MLDAVRAHTSAGGSFVTTSDEQSAVTGLEGFARAALLAAYRISGADDARVRDPLVSWLGQGVDVGTRPNGRDSWPRPADRDQSIVEAAWLAIALSETRALVWDQLGATARRNIVQWLARVRGKAVFENNWLLYPVVVDGFLAQVSGPTDPAATADALRQVDAMYRGDGWYSDGPGSCFGHYSAWGIQLLLAHVVRMTGGETFPGGPDVIRERLRAFLAQYVHLIGSDGAPVVHGRSPVYRMAVAAPFWLGELVAATPFPPATTRCITSGVLRHFTRHGALEEGIPPLGWYGSFPAIADFYSTPLSALMTCESFVGLLLPSDHAAWTDVEPDRPVPEPGARVLTTPGFVITAADDGITRLASHGATSPAVAAHPGYRRIGYSNRSAPATGALGALDIDGQVTVIADDGTVLRRETFDLLGADDRYAASRWVPEAAPPEISRRLRPLVHRLSRRLQPSSRRPVSTREDRVETASIALVDVELRITHLSSRAGGRLRDGGLAVSHDDPPVVTEGDGWCAATTADGLTGAIVALHGWSRSGWVGGAAASPFGAHTVVPYVEGLPVEGGDRAHHTVLVTAHVLTSAAFDAAAVRAAIEIEVTDDGVVIAHTAPGTYRYSRASPVGLSFVPTR